MNYNRFKYIGLEYKGFVFIDENDRRITFNKCNKEFIEKFKLDKDEFVNEWFNISHFTTIPINQHDLSGGVLIISDMKLILE
jgi:hypothetical protein